LYTKPEKTQKNFAAFSTYPHTHHFNGHFPRKPGLICYLLDNKGIESNFLQAGFPSFHPKDRTLTTVTWSVQFLQQ